MPAAPAPARSSARGRSGGRRRPPGGGGGAGRSFAVRMPCTPGIASAADVSMLRIFACGRGLGISLMNTMPSAR